jgi:uroporphyrinogen III methyltransferase / synthase
VTGPGVTGPGGGEGSSPGAERGEGVVYLVGAGPGDPGLLTVRGAEVLGRADVVVFDRLTAPSLLTLAPQTAERVDAGKQPDDRGDQEAINRLLIERAKQGLRVVRLKGGDPFVFGRGGEEALAMQAAGVEFEVVPGVTSAIAAPAYAGVPVTHRGLVTAFTVVAGHSRSVDFTPGEGGTDWEALARAGGTIVVLMGAAHRGRIAERLMAGGLPPTTPVTAVQRGTGPAQATVRTTLAGLGGETLAPPATIVIGEVAAMDLGWFESRPLFGKTVVVTRAAHQGPRLSQRLRAAGAEVLEVPAIAIAPPVDGGAFLRTATARLKAGTYSWVVFTSANAVQRFFEGVPDIRFLGSVLIAAVGATTAAELRSYRIVADLVPEDYTAEGLLNAFAAPPPSASSRAVLLPQAAGARPQLRLGLEALGWEVETLEAYRTEPAVIAPEVLDAAGRADAVCFASSSAVDSYVHQARGAGVPVPPVVACIGPVTAATARARGLEVAAEASEHTADGLVDALIEALGSKAP